MTEFVIATGQCSGAKPTLKMPSFISKGNETGEEIGRVNESGRRRKGRRAIKKPQRGDQARVRMGKNP